MNKTRECEEVVSDPDTGKKYLFAGSFLFIRMLAFAGRDPAFIFEDLAAGKLPPEEIKNVIKFSLEKINGEEVADEDREQAAIDFVEQAGLQDASMVARLMMGHAMVGGIKKKQIRLQETITGAIMKQNRSPLRIFAFIGLYGWAA